MWGNGFDSSRAPGPHSDPRCLPSYRTDPATPSKTLFPAKSHVPSRSLPAQSTLALVRAHTTPPRLPSCACRDLSAPCARSGTIPHQPSRLVCRAHTTSLVPVSMADTCDPSTIDSRKPRLNPATVHMALPAASIDTQPQARARGDPARGQALVRSPSSRAAQCCATYSLVPQKRGESPNSTRPV